MQLAVVSLLLVFTTVYCALDLNNPPPAPACAPGRKCAKPTSDGKWACNYCRNQRGTVTLKKHISFSTTRYFIFPNICMRCYDAYCYCRDYARKYGQKAKGKLWEPQNQVEFNWVRAKAPLHSNADRPGFKNACHWWIGATNTQEDNNNMRYYSTNNQGPLTMNEINKFEDCVDIYPYYWKRGDHPSTYKIRFICQVDVPRKIIGLPSDWKDVAKFELQHQN